MTFIYTIIRKKDNFVVLATDDYENYREFVINHFPRKSYEFGSDGYIINLKTRSYVYNCTKLNKDLFDVE